MSNDPELAAMQEVSAALAELDEEAAARVIRWAADRFQVEGVSLAAREKDASDGSDSSASAAEFEEFASLFFQASPSTQQEKLLVAGYWFQHIKGQDDLTAQQLNDELKHLGHQVSNVTRSFTRMMDKKPALAMQVRKTGSSRQARKIYRLTKAGLNRVEEMLAAEE